MKRITIIITSLILLSTGLSAQDYNQPKNYKYKKFIQIDSMSVKEWNKRIRLYIANCFTSKDLKIKYGTDNVFILEGDFSRIYDCGLDIWVTDQIIHDKWSYQMIIKYINGQTRVEIENIRNYSSNVIVNGNHNHKTIPLYMSYKTFWQTPKPFKSSRARQVVVDEVNALDKKYDNMIKTLEWYVVTEYNLMIERL